jgi:hypothetical protein
MPHIRQEQNPPAISILVRAFDPKAIGCGLKVLRPYQLDNYESITKRRVLGNARLPFWT